MSDNGKRVILYVEDDPDFREAIRVMIESGGYTVVEAASAEEGFEKFRETDPDLVIVDLMMEEIDAGTNLVREIRASGRDVPVYLLSSVSETLSMNQDYTELGLAGIFQKPVSQSILLSVIKSKIGEP